jgi:hypothetical protein
MYKASLSQKLFFMVIIFVLPVLISCAGTGRLQTSNPLQDKNLIQGTYTLVLYGGQHSDDLETAAFLDKEGDVFTIKPFGATYLYRTEKGMQVREAMQAADNFFRSVLSAYNQHEIRQISGPDGSAIGYELRPLLLPFVYGESDALMISYALQANQEVTVYIRKKDRLDRLLFYRLDN